MVNWLKGLFSNPKKLFKVVVDSLDYAAPFLAGEIDNIENRFKDMSSMQKSQWIIDKIQDFIRKKFNLDIP